MSDVDGVVTGGSSLPAAYFGELLKKEKYERYSGEIEANEKQIDSSEDGEPFIGRIARRLLLAGLTWEDHKEACDIAGNETPLTPYTHEAIKALYDDPPFIGIGFNSASWEDSLTSFSQQKRLPISFIRGSWLEFHKKRFTGRYFFNYGSNKFKTGKEMLSQVGCLSDLRINRSGVEIVTLSDRRQSDRDFRRFVGMGGMSLWMDDRIREGMQTESTSVLEINIPEFLKDMRILAYPIKYLYRAKILTVLGSSQELKAASREVKNLVSLCQRCLNATDQESLEIETRNFFDLSQKTLSMLSKFDFPRYSTGIDYQILDMLSEKDMQRRKEAISKIIDIYIQNFPEALAEDLSQVV
jgi:hypothetical protein